METNLNKIYKFAPASESESIVFGAAKPQIITTNATHCELTQGCQLL
jgi:hypothetical protein